MSRFNYSTSSDNILNLKKMALDLGLNANDILDIALELLYLGMGDGLRKSYDEHFIDLVNKRLSKKNKE